MIRYLLPFILLYSNNSFSQHVDHPVALAHYVFSEFTKGKVLLKSGESYEQVLNYNILTGEMIFNNAGKFMAIAVPENVDTVYIEVRKFVPGNKMFYEVLTNTKAPLLMEFTCSIKEPGANTGFGGSSNTTATTSFKSLVNSGGAYDLKLPDDFKVTSGFNYVILKDGKYQKAANAKQLAKIFPDKKDQINDLVDKNHLSFAKREDVVRVVEEIER